MFVLVSASIVGSVTSKSTITEIPEDLSSIERVFKTYDLFHSWWFITIVSLFCLNLILCIIHHFVPQVKKYLNDELFNEKALKSPWISDRIDLAGDEQERALTLEKVRKFFLKRGFNIHEKEGWLVFEKGKWSRLLPITFHLSMLIVILGGLYGALFGFVGTVNIHANDESKTYYNWTDKKDDDFGYTVRVDEFHVEYYPAPVTIAVSDTRAPGKIELHRVTEQEPFGIMDTPYTVVLTESVLDARYTQALFYYRLFEGDRLVGDFYDNQEVEDFPFQLYYPVELMIAVRSNETKEELFTKKVALGESFPIEGTDYTVVTRAFDMRSEGVGVLGLSLLDGDRHVGDFNSDHPMPGFGYSIGIKAVKYPRPPERIPKTLRAKLQIIKDGALQKESEVEVNHPMSYGGTDFFLTSFDRDMYGLIFVGLQVVSDPGIMIVYTGFILMFFAVSFIFFVSHKKIYITIENDYINIVGETTKDKAGFKTEFFHYIDELGKI